MKLTKKRVVLFLLFIFPLICFLLLSTGSNNFTKLPIVNKNIKDIAILDSTKTFKNNISIVCFLGNEISKNKGGFFNLNEKIYKKFIDYNNFQIIAIYPENKEEEVAVLKKEISAFTDMVKWNFVKGTKNNITELYTSFKINDTLNQLYTNNAFLIDKNAEIRGRADDLNNVNRKIVGYNMNSVADLNKIMKDDVLVLYYEYYAAFKQKNKNKADRKEVGL
ncbi:hypothetical protein [uncultured Polaribacter sp.]|uniref:hypothetical protein n=1 Tax=uncultured Polaribacter sp. TaxID=174711 RepID=UPI002621D26B|nr:hypothetical protein [uncultured Polaribacter sp.]